MSGNLQEVISVLSAADPRHGNHQQALQRIGQLQQVPEFFSCCATIFASRTMDASVRMQAGFQIKNNIMNPACIHNATVRDAVLGAIGESEATMRRTASSVVSAAVRNGAWDVVFVVNKLLELLHSGGTSLPHQVHGCVLALAQIVEDCVPLVEARGLAQPVVQALCPCVLYENHEKIRLNAVIGLSVFLEQAGIDREGQSYAALQPVVLPLINCMFQNIRQPLSPDITEQAVKCLVLSLTFYDQIDAALFNQIAQLMLEATQVDPEAMEGIRLEATEFWRAVLCFPSFPECVFPALGQIIPLLIDGMVYSRMELGMLQANAQDAHIPDRAEDIKPRHYEGRTHSTGDNDGDDDDDGTEEVADHNVRRASAIALDDIAEHFGDRILDSVLCVIDAKMQPSQDWRHLEAAILALGAIAEGCFEGLRPYLEAISIRLLTLVEDPSTHFLVTNISIWALRRLAQYLLADYDAAGGLPKLQRFVACLCVHMKSQSKLVQEAACCALTDICDQADDGQLQPFLLPIAQTVSACIAGYQLKNRIAVLELLQSLCNRFGSRMAEPDVLQLFLNPLIAIWQHTPGDSHLLFPIFTAMSSLCTAVGAQIQPLAKDIFDRAYAVYHTHMNLRTTALAKGEDPPEYEFIVTSVDLLSGLFDALGSSLEPLVQACQPAFVQMTLAATCDELHEIRQSGFALMGDLAKCSPRLVQDCLPQLLQAVNQNCQNLNEFTAGCISNAAWCVFSLLEHQLDLEALPQLNLQTLPPTLTQFMRILVQGNLSAEMKNMAENIVLLIGNVMHSEPTILVSIGITIDQFVARWLEYARNIKKVDSRVNAARGALLAIQQNPSCLRQCLPLFFDFAGSVMDCPEDVMKAVSGVLTAVKSGAPHEWATATRGYSPVLMQKLFVAYGVR